LKEFKAIFSIVVCELKLKNDANYTKAFAFKQLARYVHYEALDVYEQHSLKILGVTKSPNPAYAIAITTACQTALQATLLEILSFATSHYVTGMQLVVVYNYLGHVCNYKFGIV
jgi:hypothetical protein